ncbi:NAD(P)-binding protein [Endozoicomonas sp. Mp262]|uniref:NAD(P)/FAD-dependent oxidoreductase n=1 Tax=Endozoicomonas sp. Mp262 TaxID=2919499 RepID=UPI0021DAE25F
MKIAVIGAGLSGLKAALELEKQGHTVRVFEKSRGRGGRLACKRLGWGVLDIGAQYFTARTPAFQEEVSQWVAQGVVKPWPFIPCKMSDGLLSPSPDSVVRYVGMPAMNSIAHFLSTGLTISFNTAITQLKRVASKWTLVAGDDEVAGFDWVILSIPAEQCRPLVDSHSAISSELPVAPHTPCWALGLATKGKVPFEVQGIFGDSQVSWVSRQSAKPGQPKPTHYNDLWMMHFSPGWSRTEGKESTIDLPAVGVEWLKKAINTDIEIVNHFQHFWRYANLVSDGESSEPHFVDSSRQLAVIGAWCCGGRVEGAYESAMSFVKAFSGC